MERDMDVHAKTEQEQEEQLQKMQEGKLFEPVAKMIQLQNCTKDLCHEFNLLYPSEVTKRQEILRKILGKMGNNVSILSPFWCDYGFNIEIGDNFFANHGLTIFDPGKVSIGNNVFIANNCKISTAGHPIDQERRNKPELYGHPITIEDNVWIGANVTILAGVTIGQGVVIGAGSVVNKDIAANCLAVGCPCKVKRQITQQDRLTSWERVDYYK